MLVLGWHGGWAHKEGRAAERYAWHDASAVLLRDGAVVAAIEEERLNRVKHTNDFPSNAIRFCLKEARASINELDGIGVDTTENMVDHFLTAQSLENPQQPRVKGRQFIAALFEQEFGVDVSAKLHFCKHHLAHVYAGWYASGFSEALSVCIDGDGEGLSGLIAKCGSHDTKILRNLTLAQSLGHFYLWAIGVLGYQRFDEYKAMGLAPYGSPKKYFSLLGQMYDLQPEGRFEIKSKLERMEIINASELAGKFRRKGEPFLQEHKDFAAALQDALERIVEHVVGHFQKATGQQNLCLTGGVAQNCSMNGRFLRSKKWQNIYIQPAAYDAGNALGAALSFCRDRQVKIEKPLMPHVYYGSDVGATAEIIEKVEKWGPLVQAERKPDISQATAQLIAEGKVVGWVQGRSEFGPRALGNRSILADPRPAENKDRINSLVKKREGYRPFAPAILEERLHDYFEVPAQVNSLPFMIATALVRPCQRETLGAITHVDGSARVQTVSSDTNRYFHALIKAFEKLSGVPIVLNTSFNNNREPIVETVDDAIACFLTTGIDYLIIGEVLVTKVTRDVLMGNLDDLAVRVPSTHILVRRLRKSGPEHTIEFVGNEIFGSNSPISREMYSILSSADGQSSLGDCCRALGFTTATQLENLHLEMLNLWEERVAQLRPASIRRVNDAVLQ